MSILIIIMVMFPLEEKYTIISFIKNGTVVYFSIYLITAEIIIQANTFFLSIKHEYSAFILIVYSE